MTVPTRLLGGRYELGEVIGRGGMAEVLLARDVRLGRNVAVKVLRTDLARDPSFQGRFRREAQAAASLDAPSIVSVYDTGEDDDGVPYIVMEHVGGRTLREVLQGEGRLLPQRALEVTADVCAALEVAHTAGIVHRDIKPANVMLTPRGEIKVMDFGIARAAAGSSATMTQTAAVIGTAAYLSPEQARGEHVDARSDVYSTGCLLYELLTGSPPFVGDSPIAVAYQHVREAPTPPSAYDESLTGDVDAVVLKAMAKNPANRYQSAEEMREDLLRAAAGVPVQATPVLVDAPATALASATLLQAPVDRRRRRRGLVLTLFGLLLAGVALGVALLVQALLGNDSGLIKPPVVVGQPLPVAVQQLTAAGLRVGRTTERFDPMPSGIVLMQSPDEHFFVRTGGVVDLVVSKGIEMTVVPQVLGRSQQEAEATLSDAKLRDKVITRDGNVAAGTVLDVIPKPGVQLAVRTEVTLVVASGNVQVPDVRGKTQEQAVQVLGMAGFSVGLRPVVSAAPFGVVVAEAPVNTLAQRGSTVVVDVTAPAPSPSPVASATATPTTSASPTPATTPTPAGTPTPSVPAPSPTP